LRIYLYFLPSTNLDIGSFNIHHLFVGILLIIVAGLPLILFSGLSRLFKFSSIAFGSGLSLILDEWLYLIVTDGSVTGIFLGRYVNDRNDSDIYHHLILLWQ